MILYRKLILVLYKKKKKKKKKKREREKISHTTLYSEIIEFKIKE